MNDVKRFSTLLDLLNYKENIPSYHRGNLIHAIMDFAASTGDVELEESCQREIERIKAKNSSYSQD
ncbi:hypothetical protein Lbir_1717 [Legionella birminghamensis]|uniref:Uncharacterized protein n=1 Tax=Legionella birminghamensis TaxID=28083 RepID=A0A378JTY7_9GAMM|nr:hypothetical protein [Legionella birminghamensis]KTC71463.1 hypothetical protein Lbir_1717 [Legionella birminghamensis]STX60862.1 Uncharacterised protein [Legionella birminghamensis]